MAQKNMFADGEKVLCFHGPLIYEAKALKSTITKDKQVKYYIHYAGWNKNWDEWVPENRVLKYNEVNVQRQKEVYKQQEKAPTGTGRNKKGGPGRKSEAGAGAAKDNSSGNDSRASTPSKELNTTALAAPTMSRSRKHAATASNATSHASNSRDPSSESTKNNDGKEEATTDAEPPNKKKRMTSAGEKTTSASVNNNNASTSAANGSSVGTPSSSNAGTARTENQAEGDDQYLNKTEVKIKMPDELKVFLTDDWDAITRQHKLLDVPAKITVQDIVDHYLTARKAAPKPIACKEEFLIDAMDGIIEYFDVVLGSQLLYKFERPQYAEILQQNPDKPMSKIYGAFHLLRLFVRLGNMLCYSELEEKNMQCLLLIVHDFLKFLVKQSSSYFTMSNFVNVGPEYHRTTQ